MKDEIELCWLFVMRDVSAGFDGVELRVRDGRADDFIVSEWNGIVVSSPEEQRGFVELSNALIGIEETLQHSRTDRGKYRALEAFDLHLRFIACGEMRHQVWVEEIGRDPFEQAVVSREAEEKVGQDGEFGEFQDRGEFNGFRTRRINQDVSFDALGIFVHERGADGSAH